MKKSIFALSSCMEEWKGGGVFGELKNEKCEKGIYGRKRLGNTALKNNSEILLAKKIFDKKSENLSIILNFKLLSRSCLLF